MPEKIYIRTVNMREIGTTLACTGTGVAIATVVNDIPIINALMAFAAVSAIGVAVFWSSNFPLCEVSVQQEGGEPADVQTEVEDPPPTPIRDALIDAAKRKATQVVMGEIKKRLG